MCGGTVVSGYDQWKTASPYDEEQPCEVCSEYSEDCECPECPSCGEQGNPVCHAEAGIFGGCKNDFAYRVQFLKKYEGVDICTA